MEENKDNIVPGTILWRVSKRYEDGYFKISREIIKDSTDRNYFELESGIFINKTSKDNYLDKETAVKAGKEFLNKWIKHLEYQISTKESEIRSFNSTLKEAHKQLEELKNLDK